MKKGPLIIIALSLALFSCGPYAHNTIPVGAPGTQAPRIEGDYRICPGDHLSLRMFYNPDLNQEVTVRPDGRIQLMLMDEIKAVGLTPAELKTLLEQNYAKSLQQPEIAVIVSSFAGNHIFIGGEIANGPRELMGPTTIVQAIMMAGGFKDTSRKHEVLVMRLGEDGKPFMICVDVEKAMRGIDLSQDIYLKPYDVVLVPRKTIGDLNAWASLYLQGALAQIPKDFLTYYGLYNTTIGSTTGTTAIITPAPVAVPAH